MEQVSPLGLSPFLCIHRLLVREDDRLDLLCLSPVLCIHRLLVQKEGSQAFVTPLAPGAQLLCRDGLAHGGVDDVRSGRPLHGASTEFVLLLAADCDVLSVPVNE